MSFLWVEYLVDCHSLDYFDLVVLCIAIPFALVDIRVHTISSRGVRFPGAAVFSVSVLTQVHQVGAPPPYSA